MEHLRAGFQRGLQGEPTVQGLFRRHAPGAMAALFNAELAFSLTSLHFLMESFNGEASEDPCNRCEPAFAMALPSESREQLFTQVNL